MITRTNRNTGETTKVTIAAALDEIRALGVVVPARRILEDWACGKRTLMVAVMYSASEDERPSVARYGVEVRS